MNFACHYCFFFLNLPMFIIYKMLGLRWILAFEIMKIHAVTLKIGYIFCNHSFSAEIHCEAQELQVSCVCTENNLFSQFFFFLPQNDLSFQWIRKGNKEPSQHSRFAVANFGFCFTHLLALNLFVPLAQRMVVFFFNQVENASF